VWSSEVQSGSFWPDGDPVRGYPLAVLGTSLRRELFDDANALGQTVRIGGMRFRVLGIMESKGSLLGIDLDDTAFIPVATAQRLFNRDELFEIDLVHGDAADSERVVAAVRSLLTDRHDGNEDFTITTQAAMLDVFGNVMGVITMAVGAIAGISLLVGAIGILTMMWIAVGERIREIGLVRAIGATRRQVRFLFLGEASLLAGVGGGLGLLTGLGLCALLRQVVPGLPIETPPRFVVAALVVSVATGLLAGALPAQRAASLEPIEALHAE
jgi:putative ABC transport system permease protein